MKKVLKGMPFFSALGFKNQMLALAVCVGVSMGTIHSAEAAPARNVNPPALKANAPNVYVVKKGDTLWDISKRFLKNPVRWPEIWASNKHVKNPHWIFPGDRLLMCDYQGRPIIGKDEGDGCDGIISRYLGSTSLQPQIRVESLNNTIPVIPLEHIKQWLERYTLMAPDSVQGTPYILGTADQRVLAGKGQKVYVRGNGLVVGQRYAVYREAEPYVFTDANGKKYTAALELQQVASGIAVRSEGEVTTLELTDSYNAEVRRGDRVLAEYDPMLPTLFYPTNAESIVPGGQIVRVLGSIGTAARHSVVTLDRGTAHGVQTGHVFSVNQKGEVVTDPKTKERVQLPGERIGQVMVFKAFDQLSYAYVLDSELPIKVGAGIQPPLLED
ncbi:MULTISPECIES: LysM peptidoglycan-binding domain-containing protein [Acinetobacter]|uniref:LysM peptidoglycan-binding domain-containing protein n=1 Tax=Acinetobacter TaxID=469 RepID=UPI000C24E5E2|nr:MULTISPECIES: LysM peptidoglycan-binding domain-containing protein [Acinetobacter]MDH5820330.1 LysM peptidoglycan-binding domain-containing protein [Acinetobacter pseudolwoffii]MDM1341208.1 LysM peptidoglycan-binding domain-containing protein [Acinetobacter pseudolwoffii]PJI29582.1 peptidoglycan-binding protein LysM [Acinetobacter pseudolwoffii]